MTQQSVLLIGIDDTDSKGTAGTGRLARMLVDELIETGCEAQGVTRHQFLVDPRIPYTSHNSAACLALGGAMDVRAIRELCLSFLRSHAAEGSQPGLCVAWQHQVPDELAEFGQLAQRQVVEISQALILAERIGLWLAGVSEPAQGVIGALGSVGLRAGGNDGRFIHLAKIRQALPRMSVEAILALGLDEVVDRAGKELDKQVKVDTLDWIRPRLEGHRAKLYLERSVNDADVWVPADRSKSRRLSQSAPNSAGQG